MPHSTEWYASPIAVALVGFGALAVGVAGCMLTWWFARSARTSRGLRYALLSDTALLASSVSPGDQLEVRLKDHDQPIIDPHVALIRLRRTGPRDIRPTDFMENVPLEIKLGTTIVKMLGDPPAKPNMRIDGESILLGPSPIRAGWRYTVSVLTDGPVRQIGDDSQLADVRVAIEAAELPGRASGIQKLVTWALVAFCAWVLATYPVGAFQAGRSAGSALASFVNNLGGGSAAVGLLLLGALFGAGTTLIGQLLRRRQRQT